MGKVKWCIVAAFAILFMKAFDVEILKWVTISLQYPEMILVACVILYFHCKAV